MLHWNIEEFRIIVRGNVHAKVSFGALNAEDQIINRRKCKSL